MLYGRELTFNIVDMLGGYYTVKNYDHANWPKYLYANSSDIKAVNYCATYIENIWNGIYLQIANLNSLLETIDERKGIFSGDNYNLIKGEALGLRAYLHFDLLRLFAEAYATGKEKASIPYVTTLSPSVTPLFSQEDAISMMLEDLENAKDLLSNDPMRTGTTPVTCLASLPSGSYLDSDNIPTWHNRRFRFNYYAAVATMARIYLWKGDQVNALRCAQEVIDDQESKFPWVLTKNVTTINGTVRNQDRSFATEHIFALNVTDLEDLMDTYIFNGEKGISAQSTGGENTLFISVEERNTVYEGYTADLRYQYCFEPVGTGNYCVSKFYQNNKVARYFQERLPLIRLSEMYYIAAECAARTEDGVDYLEQVRSHRGLLSYALDRSMSKDDLAQEIGKEYKKEFWGEGQLWYYYKRKADITFSTYMTDIKFFTFEIPDIEKSNAGRDS